MEQAQIHVLSFLSLTAVAVAQAPPNYYQSVDPSSAGTLRATLHEVIDDHEYYVTTAHSEAYVRARWSRFFEVMDIVPALSGVQDLVVLRRP